MASLMHLTGVFSVILIIYSTSVGCTELNKVCERILVSHKDDTNMPFVQLLGIYRKFADDTGHPMFKHEQRDYYFEYVSGANSMAFTIFSSTQLKRLYVGLKAVMRTEFVSARWSDTITNHIQPYERFIRKWDYYDWQSKSHIPIASDAVSLTCISDDMFRCSTERVFFNTTFTSTESGKVLHNYTTDYFKESTGGYSDYKNFRKKYRHNRQTDWILYYESPYWMVKNDRYSYYKPFLRAKDSSFRPEYITAVWEHLDGNIWRTFTNPVGIRCRGFVQQFANGTVKLCSGSNPCANGGECVNSKLTNETICRCNESYTDLRCDVRQKICPKYVYDPFSVADVFMYDIKSSNLASVFCKAGYRPRYFLSQCETSYSSKWTPTRRCYRLPVTYPSTSKTHRTTKITRAPIVTIVKREAQKKPFTFDDYPAARPVLLTLVCLLQILVPIIHMCVAIYKDKSSMRVLCMHASISYICWLVYFWGCQAADCKNHGNVLRDFILMSVIMVPFSYAFMIVESCCCSAERQYLSSVMLDVSVADYVDKLKRTDPQRVMMIECYHWETRTRTVYYTDANGNTQSRTETYQEMVVTYTEQKIFPIGCAVDISSPDGPVFNIYKVTRLKLTPDIQCGDDETLNKFNKMRDQMIEENEHRDVHINFTYDDVIDGFQKRICAYSDGKYKPFWMNSVFFWIATILGFTWVFRMFFNWKTNKVEYTIKKLFYISTSPTNQMMPNITADAGVLHPQPEAQFQNGIPLTSAAIPNQPPPSYNEAMQSENV